MTSNQDSIAIHTMQRTIADMEVEQEKLLAWIDDLQSGMYINCVYCGHRYGPSDQVSASMRDVLKEHVEECPKHPMSKVIKTLALAEHYIPTEELEAYVNARRRLND